MGRLKEDLRVFAVAGHGGGLFSLTASRYVSDEALGVKGKKRLLIGTREINVNKQIRLTNKKLAKFPNECSNE